MEKDFIIDQVSWHTNRLRNYEFDNSVIYKYFKSVIEYLQNNGLTTRMILAPTSEVKEETCIMAFDLTEDGMSLIKKAYGNWVDSVVDKKIESNDYKILDRALKKIRQSKT